MKCLIVSAFTNSEWDSVRFAVIPLSFIRQKFLSDMMTEVKSIRKKHNIYGVSLNIYADNADFFADKNDDCPFAFPAEDEIKEGEVIVIDLPEDYEGGLQRTEQVVKDGHMKIDEDTVTFIGYGKHTSEEFWTEPISLKDFRKRTTKLAK